MNAESLQYFALFYAVHSATAPMTDCSLQSDCHHYAAHPFWHGKCVLAAFKEGKLIIFTVQKLVVQDLLLVKY